MRMSANESKFDEVVVTTIAVRGGSEELRISILAGDDSLRFSMRQWFSRRGVLLPSRYGVSAPIGKLPDIAAGLALAVSRAKAWGVL